MGVKTILYTFLILLWGIAVSATDTAQVKDSTATRLPEMDEFVPVEVIAEMIHYETPRYPREAEQANATGTVWVKSLVGRDGSVLDATVYRSSGNRYLDEAAVAAAPGCRFKPAIQGGKPVAMWVTYKVEFKLRKDRDRTEELDRNFTVESRVDTSVSSLSGDSVTGGTASPGSSPVSSKAPTGQGDIVRPRVCQQFGILILNEMEAPRRGRPQTMALIDGGCATGITIGTRGAIWDESGKEPVKLASVEVMDVQAFESLCEVEPLRQEKVSLQSRITLDATPLRQAELLSRAESYYSDGMLEHALACYEMIGQLADSNAVVRARLDECNSANGFEHALETREDSAAFRRRIPGWLAAAGGYVRLGKPSQARRLASRLVAVDSTSEGALELLGALDAYDACQIDLKGLFFGSGDTTKIDRMPRMAKAEPAHVNFPLLEYYSFAAEKNRPPDTVWVRALVSSKGNVLKAEVHRSSGVSALDRAAVESAYRSKFEPGVSCGHPLAMWVKWKIEFTRKRS
jgi:TonB family protein